MSLRSYPTADGTRWQVRWYDHRKKLRGRTFTSKSEAQAFDADVKAKKWKGEALPRTSKDTLAQAYDEWWRLRGSTLAPATKANYKAVWNAHIKDRFDDHPLSQLASEPQLFEELLADMRDRGVGASSQRKVLVVMSAVLTAAVDWRKIPTNPLWRMRKPSAAVQRSPHPFPPLVIERIRLRLIRRARKADVNHALALGDAAFVSLMAYAGMRPAEALALTWRDVAHRTILVDKSLRDGFEAPTKTGAIRTVPLPQPLRDDLHELQTAQGSDRRTTDLVIPMRGGGPWTRSVYNNWRTRVWKPALEDLGPTVSGARPYDCRGSFVSLHLRAGASPLEVASWAGHSPAVMFRHYANVIEELKGALPRPVDAQIEQARGRVFREKREDLDRQVREMFDETGLEWPADGPHLEDRPDARRTS